MESHASSMTERQVAAAGETDLGFTELVVEHHADLVRLAFAMLGEVDLANDAVQAAWIRAWCQRRTLREAGKVRGWLFTITANEARRLLRRRLLHHILPLGPFVAAAQLSTDRDREGEFDLIEALQRLAIRDREILARRYALGQTSSEIAAEVGLSDSGVRVRIRRLLAKLSEVLEQ